MKMKKFKHKNTLTVLYFILALIVVSVGGYMCINDGIDIEKTAMIKTIGADVGDKSVLTCVQNSVGAEDETSQIAYAGDGSDFSTALEKLSIASDKNITSAFIKHYVIGTETAEKSVATIVDFFVRSHSVQMSSDVYLAKSGASEYLKKAAAAQEEADLMLSDLQIQGNKDGYYMGVPFVEVLSCADKKYCCTIPVIDMVEVNSTDEKSKHNTEFQGYGILNEGRVKTYLDKSASRGCNFAVGKAKNAVLKVKNGGTFTFEARGIKSHFSFYTENDELKRVDINISFSSYFRQTPKKMTNSDKEITTFEILQEELVKHEVMSAVKVMQDTGLDFFDIEESFGARHPYMARKEEDFSSLLKRIEINTNVNCTIKGTHELEQI